MNWRLILICSFTLFLWACQTDDMQGRDVGNGMVVMPVEYYSGAPISNVLVEVYDEAGKHIRAEMSDGGEAVFPDLKPNETYILHVGQLLTPRKMDRALKRQSCSIGPTPMSS